MRNTSFAQSGGKVMFKDLHHDILTDMVEAQVPASDSFLAELGMDVRLSMRRDYKRNWEQEKRDTMDPVIQRCLLAECQVLIEQKGNGRPRLFCCEAHKKKFGRIKALLC